MTLKQTLMSIGLATLGMSQPQAATITPLWEPFQTQLKQYQLLNAPSTLIHSEAFSTRSQYQLNFIYQNKTNDIKHQRFQMRYQGLDIFGFHTLLHHYPNHKTLVTGHLIQNIEHDVHTLTPSLSETQALANVVRQHGLTQQTIKLPNTQKIIFIDSNTTKAHLAYLVSFFGPKFSQPMHIIDAHTGKTLKQWNNMKSEKSGLGPGGNTAAVINKPLTYLAAPNLATTGELPPFDVTIAGATYSMSSENLELRDYPAANADTAFPISVALEGVAPNPLVYSFTGTNNNVSQAVALAPAPNNDAMFHAGYTLDMLSNTYGLSSPIGTDIPLRIYTRIDSLDNAFSIDTVTSGTTITSHQQLVIGNGNTLFFPLVLGTMAHELCHNVTAAHSALVYSEQSGGMNESFSDICEMAFNAYVKTTLGHDWFWDGTTYNIGAEEMQTGLPLRFFETPSDDGSSIDSANDYTSSLDVHYSSGVFNRAYYLLSVTYGFGPQTAFQYMVNANANYWVPNNTFAYGACGTIQAAYDRNENYKNVIRAFSDVGVECKLFSPLKQVINNSFTAPTRQGNS